MAAVDPGEHPAADPGERPGAEPGQRPAAHPGERPGADLGEEPGAEPGQRPGAESGERPGVDPGGDPGQPPGAGGEGGQVGGGGGPGAVRLLTPPRVRELLARHGLRPTRSLGQNYLADPNTARKVVRLAGVEPGETVLEIGPGLGSLTLALREAGAAVVAVEVDARLVPPLTEVLAGDQGVVVEVADALRADLAALAPGARRLVANLPYNIAAPLVLRVLASYPQLASMTVMVQREVGERLAAAPGTAAYAGPSAKVAALAEARVLAPVSRRVFIPEPHVDSVLVGIHRRGHPATEGLPWPALARVIDAAFSQRRKTLRNSLRTLGLGPDAVAALGARAGVDLALRAERLGVEEFAALARTLEEPAGDRPRPA